MAKRFNRIWIDAGGTHVRALGQLGAHRVRLIDIPASAGAVETTVRRVRARLAPAGDFVVGLRGVWTAAEKAAWKKKLVRIAPRLTVMSDIEHAHAMAFADGVGILLNAGTGSIAFGRNAKGETARAGGLGPLLGDEGSAFWIGKEYIRRVERHDRNFSALRKIAVSPSPVAAIASRAKLALTAAERGGEAKKIIQEAQSALRGLVKEVQKKLGGKNLPVALQGGLFESKSFRKALER